MYTPDDFKVIDRRELLNFINANSFGTLISWDSTLHISMIPFVVSPSEVELFAHLSKENPHYAALSQASETLVLFQGPHAYISPSWYVESQMVPTWNFQGVIVKGRVRLASHEELLSNLAALSEHHERNRVSPWSMRQVSDENLGRMVKHIGGFSIAIDEIQGKYKLSQNRSYANRKGVISGLKLEEGEMPRRIAEEMLRAL